MLQAEIAQQARQYRHGAGDGPISLGRPASALAKAKTSKRESAVLRLSSCARCEPPRTQAPSAAGAGAAGREMRGRLYWTTTARPRPVDHVGARHWRGRRIWSPAPSLPHRDAHQRGRDFDLLTEIVGQAFGRDKRLFDVGGISRTRRVPHFVFQVVAHRILDISRLSRFQLTRIGRVCPESPIFAEHN